jgi:hypothetical protein
VGRRDTLGVEIGAALAILGLLLVFLPLFLSAIRQAAGGREPARTRRLRIAQAWVVPGLIALAAADATLGLLTLWGTCDLGKPTAISLVVLVWLVASLSAWAVATRTA